MCVPHKTCGGPIVLSGSNLAYSGDHVRTAAAAAAAAANDAISRQRSAQYTSSSSTQAVSREYVINARVETSYYKLLLIILNVTQVNSGRTFGDWTPLCTYCSAALSLSDKLY